MADTAENLRSFLLNTTALTAIVADRVHQAHVPENRTKTYIYFRRATRIYEHTLDSAAGEAPRSELFDLECCSREGLSDAVADQVRALFPCAGSFGDQTIKGAFVNDQDEDYIPINQDGDDGVTVQALQLEICP